jgi:hypothetical protein
VRKRENVKSNAEATERGHEVNRRRLLQAAAALGGTALVLTGGGAGAAAPARRRTPALTPDEMAAVDAALGKKGRYVEAEATYTVPLPRADLKVSVQGDPVPTALGFGGWVSLKHTLDGRSTVLMSDTVLLQDEVNPLISAAQANGLEVSAIHNHFFYEEPRIFYMHVHGMGAPRTWPAATPPRSGRPNCFPPTSRPRARPPSSAPARKSLTCLPSTGSWAPREP